MKRSVAFLSLVGVLALAATASAQVPYSVINSAYSQSFDTLPTSGNTNAWSNNVTLLGWYAVQSNPGSNNVTGARDANTAGWAAVTNIRAGDGSNNTGALWSFGTGTSSERALGSVGSGGAAAGDFVWALVLQNTTGTTLTDFTLNYVGEEWRDGGNTNVAQQVQKLEFDYAIQGTLPTNADLSGNNLAGYTAVPSLDFTGPIGSAVAAPLDGNLPANRSAIGATVNLLNWTNGAYLVLRWWDDNHPGNDNGLSIDDLSVRATPEPATMALLGLGGLLIVRRKR